ncbi:MAG: ABC transporter ATP-binding protein [Lachnospiraceae bacterium]|nr:ABC transporter ATP-binding protein [Lachnospiraceae bacterium]
MIEVKNLSKTYGNHAALDGLSFTVEPGKIYGLLGPNGAGKSTTMNIMTGYIAPSGGSVTIDGYDILKDAKKAKAKIGYLPEMPPLYQDMTVAEYLNFVADLKGVKKSEKKNMVNQAMEKTQTDDVSNRLIKNLSKGYKQRVGIAQAIIGSPEMIILDEPTVGLDPLQITEIRELIRELGKTHTVILSSHILSEISEVCDHVFIISKGKLVLSEAVSNLALHIKASQQIEIEAKGDRALCESVLEELPAVETVSVEDKDEGKVLVHVTAKGNEDIRESVSLALSQNGIAIFGMKELGQSLEDLFLEMTQEDEEETMNKEEEE